MRSITKAVCGKKRERIEDRTLGHSKVKYIRQGNSKGETEAAANEAGRTTRE